MKNNLNADGISVNWIAFVIYLMLMTLLCSLGFWQLDRAEQKRQFLLQQQQGMLAAPVNLNQHDSEQAIQRYQSVQLTGHYDDEHSFLIDNQIVEGHPGYFVLTPFMLQAQSGAVLVNRGWLPLTESRQTLPDVSIKQPVTKIHGRINEFPKVGIQLQGAEIPTETWPAIVQVIDSRLLADKLGYPLSDFQIELDTDQPAGYLRRWMIAATIPPEKHQAYAVQWFGLALTLTVLFIWISFKKYRE